MKNIEVEVRAFVDENRYHQLVDFFEQYAQFLKEDTQITHYLA